MISKWYEVSCDKCGCAINHYKDYKPNPTKLRRDGIKVIIKNGVIYTYCKTCKTNIK